MTTTFNTISSQTLLYSVTITLLAFAAIAFAPKAEAAINTPGASVSQITSLTERLSALTERLNSMGSTTKSRSLKGTKTKMSTTTLTCMQGLVDTREDAVIAAFTKFNTDIMSALTARKVGLHDAWGLPTGSVSVSGPYKSTWTTWKTASKKAHTDLKSTRKAAWETFKTSAKSSCSATLPDTEKLEKDSIGTTAL